jgi:D-ribose pyranose/furanose isomerase RbsD
MKTIKEKFPKNPEEVAMALQKSSIAIQEIIRVYIPDEDIKEMREIVREKIEEEIQNLRQLSESQQIMYQ